MKKQLLEVDPSCYTEWFNSLPVHEQRRAIATDAIALLKARKFQPSSRTGYFSPLRRFNDYRKRLNNKKGLNCNVCQLGGLFVSLCHLDNTVNIESNVKYNERLNQIFGSKQLLSIESAFEGIETSYLNTNSNAIEFGSQYNNDKERFIAIAAKIAEHPEGLFEP